MLDVKMVKFSVIIPVYNIAPYLRPCLDSVCVAANYYAAEIVRRQTSTPPDFQTSKLSNSQTSNVKHQTSNIKPLVEIICVDDGSTDGSASLLDDYASSPPILRSSKHPNIQTSILVLHRPNRGVSAARNAALEVATGDYVCFVDGDDGVAQEYFAVLSKVIEDTSPDLVKFTNRTVKSLGEGWEIGDWRVTGDYDCGQSNRAVRAFDATVGSLIAWNGCYKRATIGDLRFKPYPNGEDILFGAEFVCRARRVVTTNAVIYKYLKRPGSAVRVLTPRHFQSICEVSAELARGSVGQWARAHGTMKYLNRKLRVQLLGDGMRRFEELPNEDRDAAWEQFFAALKVCSWSWIASVAAYLRSRVLTRWVLMPCFNARADLLRCAVVRRVWSWIR